MNRRTLFRTPALLGVPLFLSPASAKPEAVVSPECYAFSDQTMYGSSKAMSAFDRCAFTRALHCKAHGVLTEISMAEHYGYRIAEIPALIEKKLSPLGDVWSSVVERNPRRLRYLDIVLHLKEDPKSLQIRYTLVRTKSEEHRDRLILSFKGDAHNDYYPSAVELTHDNWLFQLSA